MQLHNNPIHCSVSHYLHYILTFFTLYVRVRSSQIKSREKFFNGLKHSKHFRNLEELDFTNTDDQAGSLEKTDLKSSSSMWRSVCDLSLITGASSLQINDRSQDSGLLHSLGLHTHINKTIEYIHIRFIQFLFCEVTFFHLISVVTCFSVA